MATPFTGGCMCGAVRYESSAEPVMTANCHCRDCQRATGSAYVSVLFVPRHAISITGEVKHHDVRGDRGHTLRRGL